MLIRNYNESFFVILVVLGQLASAILISNANHDCGKEEKGRGKKENRTKHEKGEIRRLDKKLPKGRGDLQTEPANQ